MIVMFCFCFYKNKFRVIWTLGILLKLISRISSIPIGIWTEGEQQTEAGGGGQGAGTRCEQGRGFRLTRNSCQTSKLATRLTALRICTGTWLSALLMVTDRTAFLQNVCMGPRLPSWVQGCWQCRWSHLHSSPRLLLLYPLPLFQTASHQRGWGPIPVALAVVHCVWFL